jgi:hypothetical protein
MPKSRLIRSVIVTVLCGVWIILLLSSRSQIIFETVSGVGLALLVVASIPCTRHRNTLSRYGAYFRRYMDKERVD